MKIPTFIVAAAVSVAIALQAWTLVEIVNLKVEVAKLKERVDARFAKQP